MGRVNNKWRVVYRFVFGPDRIGKWRSKTFDTEQKANEFVRDAKVIAGNNVEARVQPAGFRIPRNIGITINGEIMKKNPSRRKRGTVMQRNPASRLTQKGVAAELSKLGLSLRATGHGKEVRVAYKGTGNEASAYYTDDLDDALSTGKHMVEERARWEGRARRFDEGPRGITSEHLSPEVQAMMKKNPHKRSSKKKLSPKQAAWRKEFARRVKAGEFRRNSSATSKRGYERQMAFFAGMPGGSGKKTVARLKREMNRRYKSKLRRNPAPVISGHLIAIQIAPGRVEFYKGSDWNDLVHTTKNPSQAAKFASHDAARRIAIKVNVRTGKAVVVVNGKTTMGEIAKAFAQ